MTGRRDQLHGARPLKRVAWQADNLPMRRDDLNDRLNWGDHPLTGLSENLTTPGQWLARPLNDADPLSALSTLLLQLQRGARDWPAVKLLERAFELLSLQLPFDGVRWNLAPADPAAPAGEGTLVLFEQGRVTGGQAPLQVAQGEPLAASHVQLSLWRDAERPPFRPADAHWLQCLMPHLVDLWRESRFRPRDPNGGASGRTPRCQAVCDIRGRLQQVDDHFAVLLRLEWPQAPASGLPLALRRWVVAAAAAQALAPQARFQGQRIVVDVHAGGDLLQLVLRHRAPIDRLSRRQRGIADRCAAGQSGPQIAQDLGLSPSTVDKHLGVIFRKLAVNSKLQLAQRLRETTGSC